MTRLQYTPQDYLMYLNFSTAKHVLVEGRDDQIFFEKIKDQIASHVGKDFSAEIVVESAQILVNFGKEKIGNREKVERISALASRLSPSKFVGFVDREFREFDVESFIVDKLEGHKAEGRLVWTRGHSLENYCFNFQTLRPPLRALSTTVHFRDALHLFNVVFEDALRLACVITLLGKENNVLRRIQASVTADMFEINDEQSGRTLTINLTLWRKHLLERNNISEHIVENVVKEFPFWKEIVWKSDFSVVRWFTHGHIGHTVVWAVYSYCIFKISKEFSGDDRTAKREAQQALKTKESVRFSSCMDFWVQENFGQGNEFPYEAFDLLGISLR